MVLNVLGSLLVLSILLDRAAAQLYQVNNVQYTDNGCSLGEFSIEAGTLNPTRGDPTAPCTGFLNYDLGAGAQRVCGRIAGPLGIDLGEPGALFHDTTAKRICYGLGVNMHKGATEDIMLYSCDAYNEEDAGAVPAGDVLTTIRATFDYNRFKGDRCISGSDENCFSQCYSLDILSSDVGANCAALPNPGILPAPRPVPIFPYWAITCGDIDECANGVKGHCQGGLELSCTTRKPCAHNTTCTNMVGSWQCDCMDGYEISVPEWAYEEDRACQDIDECIDPDICGLNGECRNMAGSYFCLCVAGYLYNEETRKCDEAPCGPNPEFPYAESAYSYDSAPYDTAVEYECEDGFRVASSDFYDESSNKYGYSTETEFELTCSAKGEWEPKPHPRCVPVYCGDPGTVAYSVRTGIDFHFDSIVIYTCESGFEVDYEGYLDQYVEDLQSPYYYYPQTKDHYGRKCLADETWSHKFKCVDIDECKAGNPCNPNQQCINVIGSYLCICESGHRLNTDDENGNSCVEYDNFPSSCEIMERLNFCDHGDCVVVNGRANCECQAGYTGPGCDQKINNPCDIMESMGFCVYGKCEIHQEKARCMCDNGFHGKMCETPTFGLPIIIAIVALVLAGIHILILILRSITNMLFRRPRVAVAQPPVPKPSATYGGFRLPSFRPFQGPIMRRPRQMPI